MFKQTKRWIVIVVGVVFLLIGLAGFVLPLIPGFLFFAVALVLFSILSPTFQQWIDRKTRGYPKIHAIIIKVEARVRAIVGEV